MAPSPTPLPTNISGLVRRLRRQIRLYVWMEGLAVALTWLCVAFWVGLAIDYLPVLAGANEMPRLARLIMLIGFTLVLVFLIHRYVIRRAFVRLADRSLALLLERQFPQFNNTLVTAVDTTVNATDPRERSLQHAMLQHAIDQAAAKSHDLDPTKALTYGPLVRKALLASVAVVSVGLFGWLARDAFATWTSRMLLLSDEPWPRRAHIEVLDFPDGKRKVAEGSDLLLRVRAAAHRPTPPPSVCSIDFQLDSGEQGRVNMSRDGEPRGGYQFYRYQGPPFQGMLETIDFDVIGFDHRVAGLRVDVVPRPSIVDVQLDCELPAYMDQPRRQLTWRPGTSLPVGTRVRLTARVSKPLARIAIETLESGNIETFELTDDANGLSFSYDLPILQDSVTLELNLHDHDGIDSEHPYRLTINALQDLPPQLEVDLNGIGTAITPQARLPIAGVVRDDYRIRASWFQIDHPEDGRSHRVAFDLKPGGAVDETLDLRQLRNDGELPWEITPGEKVAFSVRASDFFDLGDQPNLGQSDPFPLNIVTDHELLALLEARELNLKRRFEQTISELIETRDSLLRLQANLAEAAPSGEEAAADDDHNRSSRDGSLHRLRVQRAQQQGAKAQLEVRGVADSFADIRKELINNRIDTPERRKRLQGDIIRPLESIVADEFSRWLDHLAQLESIVESDGPVARQGTALAIQQTSDLILELQQVLESMLELETFNELLDLVRSILTEQDTILQKTKDERKRQARALLED